MANVKGEEAVISDEAEGGKGDGRREFDFQTVNQQDGNKEHPPGPK